MLRERLLDRLVRWTESERFQYIRHLRRSCEFLGVNGIDGDLMEFGVSAGSSLLLLEEHAHEILGRRWGRPYRILGFDSFQGLPEPTGPDRQVHGDPEAGALAFKAGMYEASKAQVTARIAKKARDADRVHLIEGWFDETLTPELRTELDISSAAMVTIDTDLYEPTRIVLEWIEPLIQDVAILVLDDWFLYRGRPDLGQRLALTEFLDRHSDLSVSDFFGYGWHAKAFLIHRAASASRPTINGVSTP